MKTISFDSFGLRAEVIASPPVTGRHHHHQEVELNYLFSGSVTYLHRWRRRALPLRRLVAFWGSVPHCVVDVEPGSEMAWITVPLPWLLQWNLPPALIRDLLNGEFREETRDADAPERHPVRAWVREIGQDGKADAISLELQAAFLRLAATIAPRNRPAPALRRADEGGGWRHVEKMARYVAEHFSDETIDITAIAEAAGLHPKYAMTLFKKWCGLTTNDYLRQHRITHAQRLLITTDAKVIDIACASGYASSSAFYEAFQRVAGTTPAKFKRRSSWRA